MNLGDPELEMIDPTPNVHALFMQFDKIFFWTKLASRAVVRWSKRMYSCAGICSYDRGGLCDIALSEPLLKLRPRKDLVETLLHEMIHAYLFITNRDRDRDGHGPNFKAHMHRINTAAGLNISIYHDFHDEVELYQTHWWRCNGPCQMRKPHFGIVRRSMNKAPGPSEYWFNSHQKYCGGTFVKIKEPEPKQPTTKSKKNTTTKPNADITKFITSNIKSIKDIPSSGDSDCPTKVALKDSSNVIATNTKPKMNSSSSIVVSKIGVVFNPTGPTKPPQVIPVFTGKGHVLGANSANGEPKSITGQLHAIKNGITSPSVKKHEGFNSESPSKYSQTIPVFTGKGHVLGTNTNLNKNNNQLLANRNGIISPSAKKPNIKLETNTLKKLDKSVGASNPNKHKANPSNIQSPPAKVKKIDDYFKVQSILTDLYGDSVKLVKSKNESNKTFIAVTEDLVDCPVCNAKLNKEEINRHLDECLNTDIIEKLSKDTMEMVSVTEPKEKVISQKPHLEHKPLNNNTINLTNLNVGAASTNADKGKRKTESQVTLQSLDFDVVNLLAKEIQEEARKAAEIIQHNIEKPVDKRRNTISYITEGRGDNMTCKVEKDESNKVEKLIKAEPGTSREINVQTCPCCGIKFSKPVEEHLDECLAFFDNSGTPSECPSTSYSNNTTIVIDDDDDICDESLLLNATGTKTPCPCCMKMVEQVDMNDHLDLCLK